MFLKRIELSGFKSFANKTVLQFDQPMTGIVGPNGCGKSNITDAIRFVLGEQSAKSLRSGSSLNELIFAGSEIRKPVNLARVTLVFDNTARIFDSPYDEIEITRQMTRGSSDISNFINKTPCRLKDIQDLVMDTGLGRDSLSIISQGNISAFADARPEERRLLFEEAAGVAKYKKRKKVSLGKLENVHANLERVSDQLESSKKQLETLEKQAVKAEQYLKAKEELSTLEISLLAAQIEANKKKEEDIEHKAAKKRQEEASLTLEQNRADENLEKLQRELMECDAKLSKTQSELSDTMENSMRLQKQKAVLDERRKIALDSNDLEAKRQSLVELFSEARFEYEDRRRRLSAAMLDVQNQEQTKSRMASTLAAMQSTLERDLRDQRSLENRLAGVESRLAHPPNRNHGISAVLSAANRLGGIYGLVGDLIGCESEYLPAISTALGGASEQIVVEREEDARRAIGWLKKSNAGRATFLPLSVCRPRTLASWQQSIVANAQGILGTAADFVQCEERFYPLRDRLLGNILIASSLEYANQAARQLKQSVKIVTLGADVVHAGGAMTGGSYRAQSSPIPALKKEKEELLSSMETLTLQIDRQKMAIGDLQRKLSACDRELMQKRIDQEKLSSLVSIKKEKFVSLQSQMDSLRMQQEEYEGQSEPGGDSLVEQISAMHARIDALRSQIALESERKGQLQASIRESDEKTRSLRRSLSALGSELSSLEQDLARVQTRMENDLLRLGSDYSLTFEAAKAQAVDIDFAQARERISALRKEISQLGSVNLEAPKQLEETRKEYDFLAAQSKELEDACARILGAVDEMDQTMIERFTTMFDKINETLEEVFVAMFGGGHAKLSLCDPDNLLESGVDVDVQPPGKAVKNMQTFSGGEKALIAISVLFAILKARTVPLCIFDEAEAALDQANVERFARYLSRFKDQSQFITVTHRPGTMEQCDSLFGVTMQKDGVSQVLKVELKDAKSAYTAGTGSAV